jgi:hypothetical protein
MVGVFRQLQSAIDTAGFSSTDCKFRFLNYKSAGGLDRVKNVLVPAANSITLLNGPLIIIGQGPFPKIITGLSKEITEISNELQRSQNQPPYSPCTEPEKNQRQDRIHQLLNTIDLAIGEYSGEGITGKG